MSLPLDMPRPDPFKIAWALLNEVLACIEGRALVKVRGNPRVAIEIRRARLAEIRREEQQAAIDYVSSTNRSEVFSFENVCDLLDLDVRETRARFLGRKREAA